jgi:uncharacterized protein (UPF0335 family)
MSNDLEALMAVIPTWTGPDGAPLACVEKIKVLNENIVEIREMCREALEDAVLMGCDEQQIREVLLALVKTLEEPFKD